MDYTYQDTIENYLQRELTAEEADLCPVLIDAAKIWLDAAIDSTFDQVAPTQRLFDGGLSTQYFDAQTTHRGSQGYNSVVIDKCTNITDVEYIDPMGNAQPFLVESNLWIADPANRNVKTAIRLRYGYHFPVGEQNIRVTAQFSEYDGGVPSDIKICATRICGRIIKASYDDSVNGASLAEQLGDHRVQNEPTSSWINTIALGDPIVCATISQRRDPLI